jgi:Flp pilus assembly secretin CpaC
MLFRGCLAIITVSLLPLVPAHSTETGINVVMNQAKIVKLSRAADTVIVGNPEIADAAVQDASTIVLTGKGFGTTNFVVLDAQGNAIVDEMVVVSRNDANSMRIYRGKEIETLSCTPDCENAYKSAGELASAAASAAAK